MQLTALDAQHFRNITEVHVRFEGPRVFLLGANGQGKTNLLEAIAFQTALRSFRVSNVRQVIANDAQEAALAYTIEHERLRETKLEIRLSPQKRVQLDGANVTRFAEIAGLFPSVVCSSDEIQLIRGEPKLRRRALDLWLASADAEYYQQLALYTRALKQRNALLKEPKPHPALFRTFDAQLAPAAAVLRSRRAQAVKEITPLFRTCYEQISGAPEQPGLQLYTPDDARTEYEFQSALAEQLPKDLERKTSTLGPHRDDLPLLLDGHRAHLYASEGQQRSLILAFRLAQLQWLIHRTKLTPLLLLDDILGELDPERRERFWRTLPGGIQVFATGTIPPNHAEDWQLFHVENGAFHT